MHSISGICHTCIAQLFKRFWQCHICTLLLSLTRWQHLHVYQSLSASDWLNWQTPVSTVGARRAMAIDNDSLSLLHHRTNRRISSYLEQPKWFYYVQLVTFISRSQGSLCVKSCGHNPEKTIRARLFKICHRVAEGKVSPVSTFGNQDLHFKVAWGLLCVMLKMGSGAGNMVPQCKRGWWVISKGQSISSWGQTTYNLKKEMSEQKAPFYPYTQVLYTCT